MTDKHGGFVILDLLLKNTATELRLKAITPGTLSLGRLWT
jgi:hypothetical protein